MTHNILFTGHMIDKPDRKSSRFPPDKEIAVQKEIERKLSIISNKFPNQFKGIGSGACGGDIIFHEACQKFKIRSEVYLAMSIPNFKEESVSFAGINWEKRFEKLVSKLPVHTLPKTWGVEKSDDVWARTNLWMLETALEHGGKNMVLIALWDGQGGDGLGGTEHMVKVAKKEKAKMEIIDIGIL